MITDDSLRGVGEGIEKVADLEAAYSQLRELAKKVTTNEEAQAITRRVAQLSRSFRIRTGIGLPETPIAQALELDPDFQVRPHLEYLSNRLARAVRDVERGQNRRIAVSMPPRAGKSELVSKKTPLWLLRRHPEWKIVQAAYDGSLTAAWATSVRQTIEENPRLGIALGPGRAGRRWETLEHGGIFTTSVRGGLTGRGARVLIIDDPVKDFVDAHSVTMRENAWNWWLSVAQTRLEPPFLVLVVMTRWHEDDFVGRLLSADHEGNPADWERIVFPAIANEHDQLGREPGDPLYSPIIRNETREKALDRWTDTKRAVGTYVFSAMYQQQPAPAKGAIFDVGWWRYWTLDPDKATEDGRIVYVEPGLFTGGQWCDSWDTSFKSTGVGDSDFVVGQRWVRQGANRYLIAQQRGRWSFTQTIKQMKTWARNDDPYASPFGHLVHDRLIEDRANGSAIIDTLREQIAGLKPINPTVSKEARARAITPEIESGNVYLPLPSDDGNEWVQDLLSELRNFPHDAADDQVDSLTQALSYLRQGGRGGITVPGSRPNKSGRGYQVPRDLARAALSDLQRGVGGQNPYGPQIKRSY